MKKFVFDIDLTIWNSELKSDGDYVILEIDYKMRDAIKKLYQAGNTIIFHTARHWDKLKMTKLQLIEKGFIHYDSLVMGKPTADYYIDDKGINEKEFIELFNGGNYE